MGLVYFEVVSTVWWLLEAVRSAGVVMRVVTVGSSGYKVAMVRKAVCGVRLLVFRLLALFGGC